MKINFYYLLILTCLTQIVKGTPINALKAIQIMQKVDPSKQWVAPNFISNKNLEGTFLPYYVFSSSENKSFILLAGDDQLQPILGYSNESSFSLENMPPALRKLLGEYTQMVRYLKLNPLNTNTSAKTSWDNIGSQINQALHKKAGVSPLILTKWDQSPYYNALCPFDNTSNERTVSGCVATAMAMVMKYWNYPATGTGFHSYNHPKYGTLSANFANTTYNWSAMPNTVSSSNNAVATLMYHCGVSVDMNYGIGSTGGSGAYVISAQSPVTHCTEYALKNYFGYKNTLQGLERKNYTDAQWINLLKAELDAQRPIVYAGFGGGGGHCFVVDGYDNSNKLHINWGWSGSYDGYFNLNAFNPDGLGTGGGTGGFTSGHQAVVGIQPNEINPVSSNLILYSSISASPSSIGFNQGFSVTALIANLGAQAGSAFSGEIGAALFNSSNQFVDFVEIKSGVSLNPNFYNSFTFTTTGISAATPGSYTISLFSRTTGSSQWQAIGNGQFTNSTPLVVQGNTSANLKLYAAITLNPSAPIQNQALTVNFDVLNTSNSTFNGDISIDLHGSDGKWIRELSVKTGLNLPANYHYTNGLNYSLSNGLSEEPGTYQLFVWFKPSGGDWEQVASGSFSNPLSFQLQVPGLSPDAFEPNNATNAAKQLPLSFSQNTARPITSGSNCHLGNDYDFYKVVLPAGYSYTLTPRLQDSYSSSNGKDYTLDALFSYTTDGSNWSDTYDDELEAPIQIQGPATITFQVSPYFTGESGTYELDIPITRISATAIKEDEEETQFRVYPNPAKDQIYLLLDEELKAEDAELLDLQGKLIKEFKAIQNKSTLDIQGVQQGVYLLKLATSKGVIIQKICIEP